MKYSYKSYILRIGIILKWLAKNKVHVGRLTVIHLVVLILLNKLTLFCNFIPLSYCIGFNLSLHCP